MNYATYRAWSGVQLKRPAVRERGARPPLAPNMAASAGSSALPASGTGPAAGKHEQQPQPRFVMPETSVASLAKMWRMLDDDCDGLLQPEQLRTMIAAVGIPPTKQLVAGVVKCTPERWRHVGVDIDTVRGQGGRCRGPAARCMRRSRPLRHYAPFPAQFLDCCETYLDKEPLSIDAIEEVFEFFEEDPGVVSGQALRHVLSETVTSHNTQLLGEEVSDIMDTLGLEFDSSVHVATLARQLAGGHQPVEAPVDRRGSMSARLASIRAHMSREQQGAMAAQHAADKKAAAEEAARRAAPSPTPSDSDDGVF